MRAVEIASSGSGSSETGSRLRPTEVPDPVAGPGELLLEVVSAGVNRADLLQVAGHHPPPAGASALPGLECSATVAALGEGVSGFAVGDPVCALLTGGGYAERVAVPAGQVLALPDGLDPVAAGGLMETACTVWSNVFSLASLLPGQTLLVHGGTSGIGTTAIGLAVATGSPVLATAGTAAKVARCTELGATAAFDYHGDWVAGVRDATGGRGVDVVLDVVGGSYLQRNVDVLATDGRIVCIGFSGGATGPLDLAQLLAKRGAVHATGLRNRPPAQRAAIVAAVAEQVSPLVAAGRFRPLVDRRLPLAEAAQAHRLLAAGQVVGKLVLTI